MSALDDDVDRFIDEMLNPEQVDEEPFEKKEWIPPKCKYCGKENLRWQMNKHGKWHMYTEGGTKHVCKQFTTGFQKVGKTEVIK
jgi:hypothetical protein